MSELLSLSLGMFDVAFACCFESRQISLYRFPSRMPSAIVCLPSKMVHLSLLNVHVRFPLVILLTDRRLFFKSGTCRTSTMVVDFHLLPVQQSIRIDPFPTVGNVLSSPR